MNNQDDDIKYIIIVNHEEQYSIWFANKEVPPGWKLTGKSGTKTECLAHIKEIWVDMRPLSLRNQMNTAASETTSSN